MVNTETTRLQLIRDIISLPDHLVPEAQEFLNQLATGDHQKTRNGAKNKKGSKSERPRNAKTSKLKPEDDPILKFIGMASYDPPTKSIDEELYGDDPL